MEVTTAQWMEFVNTFSTQDDEHMRFADPVRWGASIDGTYTGPGRRWHLRTDVDKPQLIPVSGVTWREAAQFANWLHNGKSSDFAALESGAYDTSTWGRNPDGTFSDAPHREPGARFFIPNLDEWMKAAYYDPDGDGPGDARWWRYPHQSDDPPVSGLPGEGETSAGLGFGPGGFNPWDDITLGAYVDVQSPWGLWDLSGGTREWIEDYLRDSFHRDRMTKGSWVTAGAFDFFDRVDIVQSLRPDTEDESGFRIASAVPAPSVLSLLCCVLIVSIPRRRK